MTVGFIKKIGFILKIAPKETWAMPHNKGFEPKYVPRQRGQISLGYYTNTKCKQNHV
jgi:hypothetical protein